MKEVRDEGGGGMHSILFLLLLRSVVFLFLLPLSATLASLRSPPPSPSFLRLSLSHSSCLRYLAYDPTVGRL